jgi:hypothetical protein
MALRNIAEKRHTELVLKYTQFPNVMRNMFGWIHNLALDGMVGTLVWTGAPRRKYSSASGPGEEKKSISMFIQLLCL